MEDNRSVIERIADALESINDNLETMAFSLESIDRNLESVIYKDHEDTSYLRNVNAVTNIQ